MRVQGLSKDRPERSPLKAYFIDPGFCVKHLHLDLAVLRYSSVAKCSRQNPKEGTERERGIPMGGTNANT